jgi:hypothetical protein
MRLGFVRCGQGTSGVGYGKSTTIGESASGKSSDSWCKGNPNGMREQLSLNTSQGKSKVNI